MTECENYIHPRRQRVITAILGAMPGTRTEIIARSGLSKDTIARVIPIVHDGEQSHIGEWLPHPVGGPSMAVFYTGPGVDAIDDLPRMTHKELSARYEKSIRGTEKHDRRNAKSRSRHWEKKAAAARHTWASALFINAGEGAAC